MKNWTSVVKKGRMGENRRRRKDQAVEEKKQKIVEIRVDQAVSSE